MHVESSPSFFVVSFTACAFLFRLGSMDRVGFRVSRSMLSDVYAHAVLLKPG